ncbi:MAG: DNA topoisomerase (ATP-hydrolyzing) [Cyanobacteria bacterium P01_H01_bin.15]
MAKQLDLLGSGQIVPTALHTEMERSYLEYAMSVIVGRALPDVRDGLKPVHRRILYAMYELGLTPDRPFRKCARVVGDVLGKYHPHGDQAVYDALVRMVQDFSTRYPLLAGHGNFGSVDNDPPAAMRYTETRLAPVSFDALLSQVSEATVNFSQNFDNSQQEPVVLPAQLPTLLLNGSSGIAVGMATNVPPHNLSEVVDGLVALIDNPELSDEKLWALIPGPDFPTGGEIVGTQGIQDAYRVGRGSIPVRGKVQLEERQGPSRRGRSKMMLVITELPFQVNKAGWIEKVADLVNQERLTGIADLRDESDREGLRVVVELKRDAVPEAVLAKLYAMTPLQSNFGAIMLALVDKKPCQLSLRELLNEFLQFRETTLRRQYDHERLEAENRLSTLEGLLAALGNLDETIDILRNAPDGTTAKVQLQERLVLTESQADSILAMPMRRLTGLERQKLNQEAEDLEHRLDRLEDLLTNRKELLKSLKKELRSLKKQFGDPRRTRIANSQVASPPTGRKKTSKKAKNDEPIIQPLQLAAPAQIPDDGELVVSYTGEIKWQYPQPATPVTSIRKGEDFWIHRERIRDRKRLAVLTDTGKIYPLDITDVPAAALQSEQTILDLLAKSAQRDAQSIVKYWFWREENTADLVLFTQRGRLKRLSAPDINALSSRGFSAIKLKDDDRLQGAQLAEAGQAVVLAAGKGRALRFPLIDEQLPALGRNAQGQQGIRLRSQEQLVAGLCVPDDLDVLLVTQLGYLQRMAVDEIRVSDRGSMGAPVIRFRQKQDDLLSLQPIYSEQDQVVLVTSQERRLPLTFGDIAYGDPLALFSKLKPEETVKAVAPLLSRLAVPAK